MGRDAGVVCRNGTETGTVLYMQPITSPERERN